jgi:group I intron endonuclease
MLNGYIYCIKNLINNYVYIGSTKQSLKARFEQHKRDMHKHINSKLYKAMNEFKIENFYIELLEILPFTYINELRIREGFYIKLLSSLTHLLNKNIAGRTIAEYQKDNLDKLRIYRKYYYRTYREKHYEHLYKYRQNYYRNKKVQFNTEINK